MYPSVAMWVCWKPIIGDSYLRELDDFEPEAYTYLGYMMLFSWGQFKL